MFNLIQFVGLVFAAVMSYFTFLYYKRGDYPVRDFLVWALVWVAFVVGLFFPPNLVFLVQPLNLERVLDILTVGAFFILFFMVFVIYDSIRRVENKVSVIVRKQALDSVKVGGLRAEDSKKE